MPSPRIEAFERICREKGVALTVQRRLILASLVDRTDHPSADMVFEDVRDRLPGLSRTTVYRVLDTLVRLGAIQKVSHQAAVVRFDPNPQPHHHLACVSCARLVDLSPEEVGSIPLPDTKDSGFTITNFSVNFSGICSSCRHKQIGSKE